MAVLHYWWWNHYPYTTAVSYNPRSYCRHSSNSLCESTIVFVCGTYVCVYGWYVLWYVSEILPALQAATSMSFGRIGVFVVPHFPLGCGTSHGQSVCGTLTSHSLTLTCEVVVVTE